MLQEALGPRRHDLRQRQQTKRVACRCRIEDDEVKPMAGLGHEIGHPLEQSRLQRAWRQSRQLELPLDRVVHLRMHERLHLSLDGCDVLVDLAERIDLESPEALSQNRFVAPDCLAEHICERVCRIGRYEKAAAASFGSGDPESCRDRRLAYTALTTDEGKTTLEEDRQQHLKPSSGECSMPMRRCQS